MGLKMNFRIITENHAADSKINIPPKINFRADGTHESHPTVWGFNNEKQIVSYNRSFKSTVPYKLKFKSL